MQNPPHPDLGDVFPNGGMFFQKKSILSVWSHHQIAILTQGARTGKWIVFFKLTEVVKEIRKFFIIFVNAMGEGSRVPFFVCLSFNNEVRNIQLQLPAM